MSPVNLLQLIVLAALWGGSFLFIRVAVPDFGVAPLMALRVAIGAAFLVVVLLTTRPIRQSITTLRRRAWPLIAVGVLNSAIPFCLFAYAELTLSAGVTSVINATSPLWAALVAFVWLKDRLTTLRSIGMAIGFAGVMILVWNQIAPSSTANAANAANADAALLHGLLAAAAALAAAAFYGVAGSFTKKYLTGVDSLTVATGSMLGATLVLAPIAFATWPVAPISTTAWHAVLALGIGCTGVAYLLYFHLISVAGPTRAMTVTFVIPIFGILLGAVFLHESVSATMIGGCAVILAGTALATGMVKGWPGSKRGAAVR
jgi:drug/metabolite transporter (DMT)-like permease